jgi:hypothetical protein
MTTLYSNKTTLLLCAAFVAAMCLSAFSYAGDPAAPSQGVWLGSVPTPDEPTDEPATGFAGWLGTYNETLKMHNASIITTLFGSAFVAFFIAICWGKLVELYGALGGLVGGGAIVGTFWVMNHKLPGFGIGHDGFSRPVGDAMGGDYQYGLIVQTGPWVDMGLAVCAGLFVASFLEMLRAHRLDRSNPGGVMLLAEVFPRAVCAIVGGMAGGAVVGLIGFTGAKLF